MGAEEYELLVSTLNKLPILKENLPLKREEYELTSRMVFSQKAEIDELQKDLKTRDLEVGKIDSEIEKIGSQVEKLDPEIADLKDIIAIEEKKVEPYFQARTKALKRVTKARNSFWNEDENRIVIFSALGIGLLFFWWGSLDEFSMAPCCIALIWPFGVLAFYDSQFDPDSHITKIAYRKKDEVESELKKARGALDGFTNKLKQRKRKKSSLVRKESKLRKEKERLRGLEKKLKEMNKKLDALENSASACSKAVESLVREIHDGQNAIAPLIPYSDLLLDDGFL